MPRKTQKNRTPPSQKELIQALTDLWKFADIINFHGGSSEYGRFHKEMEESYWKYKKRARIVSRGHLKTSLSILEDLHRIYVNPNIRIFIGTGRKELGQAIMREIQQYLVDPWLQEHVWNNRPHYPGVRLIPVMEKAGLSARKQERNAMYVLDEDDLSYDTEASDKKVVWNQNQIQVLRDVITKDPTIGVGCAGSASTGFHYDVLHYDDIIDFTNYDTEDKKERLDTWKNDGFSVLDPQFFDQELYDLLKPLSRSKQYQERIKFLCHVGDEVVVNGTRYFKWDWYGEIKAFCGVEDPLQVPSTGVSDDDEWEYYERNIYRNGDNNTDGYEWEERWDAKVEASKKKNMSSKHWYRQYLNKVIVQEELILYFDKIKYYAIGSIVKEKGTNYWLVREGDEMVRIFPRICIDPAASSASVAAGATSRKKKANYTAICVGGISQAGNLYILDLKWGRWKPEEWSKYVLDVAEKWNVWQVYMESVVFSFTMSKYVKDECLKRNTNLVTVREYKPPKDRSKQERIEAGLQPLIENGQLFLPPYLAQNRELQDMFNLFPSDTIEDDVPDVIEMLREISKGTKTKPKSDEDKKKKKPSGINNFFGGVY